MALAGAPGKLEQYIAMKRAGLNAIELDVKDENGEIGFLANVPLARRVDSAKAYYNAERANCNDHCSCYGSSASPRAKACAFRTDSCCEG